MLATYPFDPIKAYWRYEITARKLRVLIENLPPGCAHYRVMHGPWQDTQHLLANIADGINNANYIAHVAAGLKPKARKPQPIPRPGEKERHRIGHRDIDWSPEDVMAYLDQFKPGSAVDPVEAQPETPSTSAQLAELRKRPT